MLSGRRILDDIQKAVKSKEITSESVEDFSDQIRELEIESRVRGPLSRRVFNINVTDCSLDSALVVWGVIVSELNHLLAIQTYVWKVYSRILAASSYMEERSKAVRRCVARPK